MGADFPFILVPSQSMHGEHFIEVVNGSKLGIMLSKCKHVSCCTLSRQGTSALIECENLKMNWPGARG